MKVVYVVVVGLFAGVSLGGSAFASDAHHAKGCSFFARHFMGCSDPAPSAPVAQAPAYTPQPPVLNDYLIHGWFVADPDTSVDPQKARNANAAAMLERFSRATGISDPKRLSVNCDEPFSVDENVILGTSYK